MHVANIKPEKKFKTLNELVTDAIGETGELAAGKTYILYNNGGDGAYIITQENAPDNEQSKGRLLLPLHSFRYKCGTNTCYVRSLGGCDLHIEEVETEEA